MPLWYHQVSDLRLASMQLAAELKKVEMLVVTEENRQLVTEQLEGWTQLNSGLERLERLLFVSAVPIQLPKPAKVRTVHPKISM